jgi:hypothetical protein
MQTIDFIIHDSVILKVIEDTQNATIDFVLDYPVDWNNHIFEKKILRFFDCLNYAVKEIPFASRPSILDFKDHGEIIYSIGEGRNEMNIKRRKIELITNAGTRLLEYEKLELINYENSSMFTM